MVRFAQATLASTVLFIRDLRNYFNSLFDQQYVYAGYSTIPPTQQQARLKAKPNPFEEVACQIANQGDIQYNPQIHKDILFYISSTLRIEEAITALSDNQISYDLLNTIRSNLTALINWLPILRDSYFKNNRIDAVFFDSDRPLKYLDLFNSLGYVQCYLPIPKEVTDQITNFITRASDLKIAYDTPLNDPVAAVAGISVDENSAMKLFDFMEKLYSAQNDNFYVSITRSTEASANTGLILSLLNSNKFSSDIVMQALNDTRVELKEARQGVKDLIGLGDEKFYEGSVSTIELMAYIKFAHESENNSLYEILIRTQEIKSYAEAIRNDTQDIKAYIDQKVLEINQYAQDLYNTYVQALDIVRSDLATQMQLNQQQLIDMISAIDTQVGR